MILSSPLVLGDPLVYSFQVDATSASLGFPWFAQGKQPCFAKPHFLAEQIKPFLDEAEIEEIVARLNNVFQVC